MNQPSTFGSYERLVCSRPPISQPASAFHRPLTRPGCSGRISQSVPPGFPDPSGKRAARIVRVPNGYNPEHAGVVTHSCCRRQAVSESRASKHMPAILDPRASLREHIFFHFLNFGGMGSWTGEQDGLVFARSAPHVIAFSAQSQAGFDLVTTSHWQLTLE